MEEIRGNKKIHYFWPQVLQEENIGVKQELLDYVKTLEYIRVKQDNGSVSKNHDILDDEIFKELKETIIDRTKFYLQDLYSQNPFELEIIASWVMKHKKGDYAQAHYHHNSYMSGVYYLQSNEKSGKINFIKNDQEDKLSPTIKPDVYRWNDINGAIHWLNVTPGNLVVFPSRLVHDTGTNESDMDRYCLAWNIMPKGKIGEKDHKWHIK
tara:strand:- start:199 stop:828 length:630 start_codon:yes stop_codon:yes gene_type:complete